MKLLHYFLMILPNILNLEKLYNNIRQPIHEFIHTYHRQYQSKQDPSIFVVEHEFFNKLVTIDIIRRDEDSDLLMPRLKRLFASDYYYGHNEYFPNSFKLEERVYIIRTDVNLEALVKRLIVENID